jgi:hypothetical protein
MTTGHLKENTMIEATCPRCGETFVAANAEDLIHVETTAGQPCGGNAVDRWADEIMSMIDDDIDMAVSSRGDVMPATVASFSELHEYVDANDYLISAEVPWSADDMSVTNAVTDEVTRRLAARNG